MTHWKGTKNKSWLLEKKNPRWIAHEVFLFLMEKSIYYRSIINTLHNWNTHMEVIKEPNVTSLAWRVLYALLQ